MLILSGLPAGCAAAEGAPSTSTPVVTHTSALTSTPTPELTQTPTLTPGPTATETPTSSSAPTPPPTPTTEPTDTPEPTPTPVCGELTVLDPDQSINIRSGPGTNYDIIGSLHSSHKILVRGMTENGGWVTGDLVNSQGEVVAEGIWITGNTERWVRITCGKDSIDVVSQDQIPPTPTTEPTTPPTQPPTEQPTQPPVESTPTNERPVPPPIMIGEEPTLEQISYYCNGYFEPVALPPHGHWGLVEDIQGTIVTIAGQKVDVGGAVQFVVHKVFDRERFKQGHNDAHELYVLDRDIEEILPFINIGAHLWVADAEIGRTARIHCDAIKK